MSLLVSISKDGWIAAAVALPMAIARTVSKVLELLVLLPTYGD